MAPGPSSSTETHIPHFPSQPHVDLSTVPITHGTTPEDGDTDMQGPTPLVDLRSMAINQQSAIPSANAVEIARSPPQVHHSYPQPPVNLFAQSIGITTTISAGIHNTSTNLASTPIGHHIAVAAPTYSTGFPTIRFATNTPPQPIPSLSSAAIGERLAFRPRRRRVSEDDDDPMTGGGPPEDILSESEIRDTLQRAGTQRDKLSRARHNHQEIISAIAVLSEALGAPGGGPDRNSRGTRKEKRKKISTHPYKRTSVAKRLSVCIRLTARELLNMESKDDPVPDGPPDNISYPTTNDFYFAWSEMMTSDWNRRALAVTYSRLLEKFDDDDLLAHHDEDTIRKKVRKHAEYLKSVWIREHNYTEEDLENYNRSRSDYTRRRGIFLRRLDTCERHPRLRKHAPLYKRMGAGGMSSDEAGYTDSETPGPKGHTKIFLVKELPYLSADVKELNAQLDALGETYARRTFLRGTMPRRRVRSGAVSTSGRIVYNLPINAYDGDFMEGLEEFDRDEMDPDPVPHDFD